jgi:BirA family biotin operon repressor/biotin-[acetyl-CoA-carboxylase] ligase
MPWHVHYVDETGSTNSDLLGMARTGAPTGTVLRAGHQTAGRGRLGRSWVAPPGAALLVSILLRPADGPSFWDTAGVAVAAAAACRNLCAVQPLLKWPNDLVVGDRKLAGILAEADAGTGAVVVGMGLNVTMPPTPELGARAVALSHLVAVPPRPAALLDALLAELEHVLAAGPDVLRDRWTAWSATLGRRVRVEGAAGDIVGTAEELDPFGALLVDGRPVHAGDVVHLRPA